MKRSYHVLTTTCLTLALGLGSVAFAQDTGSGQGGGSFSRQRGAPQDKQQDKQQEKQEKQQEKPAAAKVGEKAPDFALKDSTGKVHKLSDYKGKIVVLQWVNPGCPICKRVHEKGLAKQMQTDVKQIDANVVFLAINSTFNAEPSATAEYLKKYQITVPALDDREGKVGRLYGAKTTPHLFIIDAEGILRYQGAFDDDAQGEKTERVNYVVQAIEQITEGETVMPNTTKSYGCSIKYAGSQGTGQGRDGAKGGKNEGGSGGN